MNGNRKTQKIRHLRKLNQELELGLPEHDIESMSTAQLARHIIKAKVQNNIRINQGSKYLKSELERLR